MRVLTAAFFTVTAVSGAWAADLPRRSSSAIIERGGLVAVRPARRVVTTRVTCGGCSRLPLGGLRKPVVAHVPLGGLRKACPPVVVETIRERTVLRVKG